MTAITPKDADYAKDVATFISATGTPEEKEKIILPPDEEKKDDSKKESNRAYRRKKVKIDRKKDKATGSKIMRPLNKRKKAKKLRKSKKVTGRVD